MRAEASLAELIVAVSGGDRAALRSLYQQQATRLFGVANAILRDRDAAADAMQDAFLRISQRAGQFDPDRGEASAWLGGIVRYAALDLARTTARRCERRLVGLTTQGRTVSPLVGRYINRVSDLLWLFARQAEM